MNFLVTGGAGFIGSHVCERLLREGHSVWAFDDLNHFYDPQLKRANIREIQALAKPFEFVQGDITDAAALAEIFSSVKFDQVIHLAARAGVRPSIEQPALYQRVNVEGTVNVLEAARQTGVKKIIMASSSSVYGVNAKVPFAESDPIFSAISPYAASKLACEALGHVYHHLYKMDVAMLRFFTVYGPRQRPDLAIHKFARLIHGRQTHPRFRRWQHRARSHLHQRHPGRRHRLHEKGIRLRDFQPRRIADGEIVRLIALIETALGKKAIIDRQPLQPGDVPLTFADISKARARLGYNPQIKIEQGIQFLLIGFEKTSSNKDKQGIMSNQGFTRPPRRRRSPPGKKISPGADCPTEHLWIFAENLCIEPSRTTPGSFSFGFQTKFSPPDADALEIAYDHFSESPARIVFYRLGSAGNKSVCILLCDPWFEEKNDPRRL